MPAELEALLARLAAINAERIEILSSVAALRHRIEAEAMPVPPQPVADIPLTTSLTNSGKIAQFRSFFAGRADVFPRRWENSKTGKAGYAPVCHNEWVRGVCEKPRIKCGDCLHQAFVVVTDDVVRCHLLGRDIGNSARSESFVAGVYPLLPDETCWFLAADFDKEFWQRDALAFLTTCRESAVPACLERSRSGNGGHVWLFFAEPVPASEARNLGSHLITLAMERCPEIGFESYDRFFPSQDNMPTGALAI